MPHTQIHTDIHTDILPTECVHTYNMYIMHRVKVVMNIVAMQTYCCTAIKPRYL